MNKKGRYILQETRIFNVVVGGLFIFWAFVGNVLALPFTILLILVGIYMVAKGLGILRR